MSEENIDKVNYAKYFVRALYLTSAVSILLTNQGSLQSIIISRNICIGIVTIATVCIIALQLSNNVNVGNNASYVGLYSIVIALCVSYIYYINKSYQISPNDDIITNTYSNSFLYMMVVLSFYLGYNADINIPEFVYRMILLFSSVMICLIYPLMITLIYYKTDGFHNIKSIYF